MRKTAKSQLAKVLTSNVPTLERNSQSFHVLDGVAPIHRMKWPKKTTYKDIVGMYVYYVQEHYGHCCVIFDGYKQGPSIKDHEHQRRLGKACADIQVREFMEAHSNQQMFSLLHQYLESDGQIVHTSRGYADTLIVTKALSYAAQGKEVNVVVDDTDILVLLMYHWTESMADVYFSSEAKKKKSQVWKVRDLVFKAEKLITSNLLFVHAWSGCDTTSATYGHGKASLLKKVKESEEVRQISLTMSDANVTAQQIGKVGIRLFAITYGGKKEDSLNK